MPFLSHSSSHARTQSMIVQVYVPGGVATCFNCSKSFSSHDGFGRHVERCCGDGVPTIPTEYITYLELKARKKEKDEEEEKDEKEEKDEEKEEEEDDEKEEEDVEEEEEEVVTGDTGIEQCSIILVCVKYFYSICMFCYAFG